MSRLSEDPDFLDRFKSYGSEGCTCGTHATPDFACPEHNALARLERLEDNFDAAVKNWIMPALEQLGKVAQALQAGADELERRSG